MLRSLATGTIVADFVQRAADYRDTGSKSRELRGAMVRLTISACSEVNPVTPDAVWCAFVHLWHRDPGCEGVVQFPAASRDIVLEDAQVLGVQ